jgi:hypothetical protein
MSLPPPKAALSLFHRPQRAPAASAAGVPVETRASTIFGQGIEIAASAVKQSLDES